MKHFIAMLAVALLTHAAQAADPVPVPSAQDMARLQAAEAAVRAGVNHPHTLIGRKQDGTVSGKSADGYFPLHRDGTAREFPMPTRVDAQPSPTGLQAMVTASNTASAPKAIDPQSSAALQAFDAFRRNHNATPRN